MALWFLVSVQDSSNLVKEMGQDTQRNGEPSRAPVPADQHAGQARCVDGDWWSWFLISGLEGQLEF